MNGLAEDRDQTRGVWFAFAAYGFWGVAPVYFKWVEFAEPLEILAHRIVWAFVLLVLLVSLALLSTTSPRSSDLPVVDEAG